VSEASTGARLSLVRHAPIDEGYRGRCVGRTDAPLSAAGLEAADRLGAAFAASPVDAVYSSPLRRATGTAAPIGAATGRPVSLLDGLAEVDFGALEGRTFADIAAAEPALYERWMAAPATIRFPGGEGYADLKARALAAVALVLARHPGGGVVVVAHGGPIRAILAGLLDMPDHAAFRLDVAHAAVTLVEWIGDEPVLRALNVPAGCG